jgi:hypothetical protein
LELQDWADSGAPLFLILRSATLDNASALGLARELGTIEVGKRADLLLLRQDPLRDVSAYDSIETIFLDGDAIPREMIFPKEYHPLLKPYHSERAGDREGVRTAEKSNLRAGRHVIERAGGSSGP